MARKQAGGKDIRWNLCRGVCKWFENKLATKISGETFAGVFINGLRISWWQRYQLKSLWRCLYIAWKQADDKDLSCTLSICLSEMTSRQQRRQVKAECCLSSCQKWLPDSREDRWKLNAVYPAVRTDFRTADKTGVSWMQKPLRECLYKAWK